MEKIEYRAEMARRIAAIIDNNRDRMPACAPGFPVLASEWFLGITKGIALVSAEYAVKRFLGLSTEYQNFIIANAGKVPWHGEDIDMYKMHIKNAMQPIPANVKDIVKIYRGNIDDS